MMTFGTIMSNPLPQVAFAAPMSLPNETSKEDKAARNCGDYLTMIKLGLAAVDGGGSGARARCERRELI
jgi:hypothetical protein